jgi:uncharacterized protein YhbP (UPF0306 family)
MEEAKLDNVQVEKIIRSYIPQVVHMSLATSADGKPWVCEVHFCYDDNLNLYFRSLPSTRHCQEIIANPHVAGNIVTQHFLNQAPRGVYFEGTAEVLESVTADDTAIKACSARFGLDPADIVAGATGKGPLRFYKITPAAFYLFDTYASKPARKYHLPWPAGQPS